MTGNPFTDDDSPAAPAIERTRDDTADPDESAAQPPAQAADPDASGTEQETRSMSGQWPPLWSVMAAVEHSGASTLDRWCACSREITRDPSWRPAPGHSPYLVLTAPRTIEGIRAARQLAGALTSTAGTPARIAAIVVTAGGPDEPRGGIQLKEMIAAAEAAGVPIITADHDPQLSGQLWPPAGVEGWSPQRADNSAIPAVLSRVYTRVFFTIADRDAEHTTKEAKEAQ
ncbi:hypothetical protein [Nocardia wallacei]|uniref:hypothetical protein n=1 Tax=Nocardia wallacei TaxID=480035 RepID=UPI002458F04D|nr:hypothetical protein [Nocardia wallacei]